MTRRVLIAFFIDALGSGLLGPVELLYGTLIIGIPLLDAGLALSAAAIGSVAVGPVAGAYVDRWGAHRVVVAANALGALGCIGLVVARNLTGFGVASFVLGAAVRTFWASLPPLIANTVSKEHLERSFGHIRATRLVGYTLGGLAAVPLLSIGPSQTLPTLVALDGASYLVAGALLLTVDRGRPVARLGNPSYSLALRDRANVALMFLNLSDVLLTIAPLIAMPVLVVAVLRLAPGLVGVLAAESALVVAGATVMTSRVVRRWPRLLVLATTNGIWLLAYVLMAALADPALATLGLVIGLGLAAIAEGAYTVAADAIPVAIAPPGLAGRYTALHQMAWGISESIAPALVAILIGVAVPALWLGLAALAATNVTCYLLLERFIGRRTGRVATSDGAET